MTTPAHAAMTATLKARKIFSQGSVAFFLSNVSLIDADSSSVASELIIQCQQYINTIYTGVGGYGTTYWYSVLDSEGYGFKL